MIKSVENLLKLKTRQELRDWLIVNSGTKKSCWIIISRKPKVDTILYLDAVEEAICFGWIDGIHKRISETELAQRLSPRIKNGNWTELNKERVRRLEKLGLMTDMGRKCLPDMSLNSFKINAEIEKLLKEYPDTYNNFLTFPDLYKRVRIDTIQSELKYGHPELFKKRLAKFIKYTKVNKIYGAWNDGGRLLNY